MDKQKIKELDGLRGIAIIMVFAFHLLPYASFIYDNAYTKAISSFTNRGWVGVDLFFVLSGFLITSNILETRSRDRFFINFYGRRILRIFPLYYSAIFIIFIAFSFADTNGMNVLGNYKIFYYIFIQNWVFALQPVPVPVYIAHFWTLAIEEQFYILWPVLFYRLKNRTLIIINIVAIISISLYRFYVFHMNSIKNVSLYLYASTPTRVDTIIIGSLIALLYHTIDIKNYSKFIMYILPALISMIVISSIISSKGFIRDNPFIMTFGFTIIGLIFGCILILSIILKNDSLLRCFLRNDILSFFGKYSYAIYILHMPIIVFYIYVFKRMHAYGLLFWILFSFFSVLTTVITAMISWRVLERPFLQLKRHFEYDRPRSNTQIT